MQSILIAEDDDNDVFLVKRAFAKAKIANPLVFVRDGQEVIDYLSGLGLHQAASAQMPALLLLDLNMPRLSGMEALAWIRQFKSLNRMIVVILTSSREPVDVVRAYDLHANSFLVKRTSYEEMIDLVKSLHTYWLSWNERPDSTMEIRTR